VGNTLAGSLDTAKNVLLTIGGYIVSVLVNLVLVLVIGFLWLVTADRLKAFVVDLLPVPHQALAADVFREMGLRMGGFLRATAINMVVVGVLTGVATTVIGLPSPVLLGIFAGLTAAIPLVGPFLGIVPPLLLALTIGPGHAVLVVVVLLVIQLLDANLVVPMVMNRVVSLPALAVVMSLLIGGALEGLIGALLAVPVASALQVLLLRVIVPYIHHMQGRNTEAFARAYTPLSPVHGAGPTQGGRRQQAR
jgi:predicted PurR-regulated permease PerM